MNLGFSSLTPKKISFPYWFDDFLTCTWQLDALAVCGWHLNLGFSTTCVWYFCCELGLANCTNCELLYMGAQIYWFCCTNLCWWRVSSLFQIHEIMEVETNPNTWVQPLSPVCLRLLFVYWRSHKLEKSHLLLSLLCLKKTLVSVSAHAQNFCG